MHEVLSAVSNHSHNFMLFDKSKASLMAEPMPFPGIPPHDDA